MIICDLCGNAKECTPKEIERKEYDICADCWAAIAEKLRGKGRPKKNSAPVILPQVSTAAEPETPKPEPGLPPKIWAVANPPQ